MAGLGFNLKLWTLQQNNVSEKDISSTQYYGKDAESTGEYFDLKQNFVMARNEMWQPRNQRPDKLRESIKMFEECLKSSQVNSVCWKHFDLVQVIFSSGLLANLRLNINTSDIKQIGFDRTMVNKITSISSVCLAEQFACITIENQSKIVYFALKQSNQSSTFDIPGPKGNVQPHRHLCLNANEELMVSWWQFGTWLQTAYDDEKVNIVLLRCTVGRLEVITSVESENDILHLNFSKMNPSQILTLEKPYSEKDKSLESVIYECSGNKLLRLKVVSLPVKSGILSFTRNSKEDKLVLGFSDGSMTLYDLTNEQIIAKVERSAFIPTITSWVGSLIIVGSGQGELKLFDSVLNQLSLFDCDERQILQLKLSDYLTSGNGLMKILEYTSNNILLVFNGGPLTMLTLHGTLDTLSIIQQHIKANKVTYAVNLLCSLNWNYESDTAYHGLLTIMDHLLCKPLSYEREGQLEGALSSFYASKNKITESIIIKYRTTVGCYARRFFHHLLRFQRFEKAFLLAKDISSADLFMDIYFAAKDLGEMQLAQMAKIKAEEIFSVESTETNFLENVGKFPEFNEDEILHDKKSKDYFADAVKQDAKFYNNEGTSSTLKVTKLGYV
ncbi:WD repeat-containing and planar cell polarity effector protein fritz homolog [Clavelina lepadiformis]|uniref:WD repeat-containing and planar cell polarity effector protein fritz homolog n=1 Tax=Clavelina lepadiformis TaxID=159417 RepID=UPI004042472B